MRTVVVVVEEECEPPFAECLTSSTDLVVDYVQIDGDGVYIERPDMGTSPEPLEPETIEYLLREGYIDDATSERLKVYVQTGNRNPQTA